MSEKPKYIFKDIPAEKSETGKRSRMQIDALTGEVIAEVPIQEHSSGVPVHESKEEIDVKPMSNQFTKDGRIRRGKGLDYDPTGEKN